MEAFERAGRIETVSLMSNDNPVIERQFTRDFRPDGSFYEYQFINGRSRHRLTKLHKKPARWSKWKAGRNG